MAKANVSTKEKVTCSACGQAFRPASIRKGIVDKPRKHSIVILVGRGNARTQRKITCPGSHQTSK